jgi:hypothetical protein
VKRFERVLSLVVPAAIVFAWPNDLSNFEVQTVSPQLAKIESGSESPTQELHESLYLLKNGSNVSGAFQINPETANKECTVVLPLEIENNDEVKEKFDTSKWKVDQAALCADLIYNSEFQRAKLVFPSFTRDQQLVVAAIAYNMGWQFTGSESFEQIREKAKEANNGGDEYTTAWVYGLRFWSITRCKKDPFDLLDGTQEGEIKFNLELERIVGYLNGEKKEYLCRQVESLRNETKEFFWFFGLGGSDGFILFSSLTFTDKPNSREVFYILKQVQY